MLFDYDENYEEDFEEACPYCDSYSAVIRPFSKNKYIGYCKNCGKTIFLCSECMCGEEEVEEDNPNYYASYDTDGSVSDYSVICNWHIEFDENGDEWSVCFRGKYKKN